jgi:hypothetical protein
MLGSDKVAVTAISRRMTVFKAPTLFDAWAAYCCIRMLGGYCALSRAIGRVWRAVPVEDEQYSAL